MPAASGLALAFALVGAAHAGTYSYTGTSTQNFTAAQKGIYQITAYGAQGGTGYFIPTYNATDPGGLGAEVGGDLLLTKGQSLTLLVGGKGGDGKGGEGAGGGGGGSFVALGSTPLVVAGGGGGGGNDTGPGLAGTSGGGGNGGTAGAGGSAGQASGGGGFFGDGGDGGDGGTGGKSFLNGGAGGVGGVVDYNSGGISGDGGYGGGGGGGGLGRGFNAGGGGGYSGGGGETSIAADFAGGGGSYVDPGAANTFGFDGVRSGDGEIDITLLRAVPEPATWAMMLIGLGALGAGLRGRRLQSATS
jgi:hypothetical protein